MKCCFHLMMFVFAVTVGVQTALAQTSSNRWAQVENTTPLSTETWQRAGIGKVLESGEAAVLDQRYTLRSYGTGLGGKRDSLEYMHQPWGGDGTFVARIAKLEGPRYTAVAGLMVRGSLDNDDVFFMVGLTGEGKTVVKSRSKRGELVKETFYSAVPLERELGHVLIEATDSFLGSSILPGAVWLGTNLWLKVERRGEVFTALGSVDGSKWYWLGSEEVQMRDAQVGLAVAGLEFFSPVSAQFEAVSLTGPTKSTLAEPIAGSGDGLAAFYAGRAGGRVQRIDSMINFEWAEGGPDPSIGADLFSVRWEGMLEPQYSETYAITLISDDRARLWIDDRLVVDQWHPDYWFQQPSAPAQEGTVELSLQAGQKYAIRLEYAEEYGNATAQLFWSSPSTPKQPVPQSQLYSRVEGEIMADRDADGMPDRWERAHWLNADNPADATEDASGDGIPNYKKYLAGMEPSRRKTVQQMNGNWKSTDIGEVGIAGTNRTVGNDIVVAGSGQDIFIRKDGFHFVYQPWRGDVEIVARIDPLSEVIHNWAKAGIMIREDLTDRSKNAFIALTAANGITVQHRTEFAGATDYNYWWIKKNYHWVKLVRRGDAFEMYASEDGVFWEWSGTQNIAMESDVYLGLGVTSRDDTTLYAARFSHIWIGSPRGPMNPNAALGKGDGLKATYRNLSDLTTVERTDPNVAFDWQLGAPAPGMGADPFQATWEGKLEVPYNETYLLQFGASDRGRLWLDGEVVFDWNTVFWNGDGPNDHSFYGQWLPRVLFKRLGLKAGHQYHFKLECEDESDRSLAMLYWSSPSIAAQPIPQKYFYSPANRYYDRLPDADRDGMPDTWENAYSLNANNPADANEDPDGDGLSNREEYQNGFNPWKADSNGDGLADGWVVRHGFDSGSDSIANEDADGDGLTNLQEYQSGTDPTREDSDGDGLPDRVELAETRTDPVHGDIESIKTVAEVPGNAAVGKLGSWVEENGVIHAVSPRGYVEYELNVPRADIYRLEVWGGAHRSDGGRLEFPLILSVDGELLGRKSLSNSGKVQMLTPWLPPGTHRVRVYWDNARRNYPRLQISSIKLVALQGKDANSNGVSDWVEAWLKELSGLEMESTNVIESFVSPYPLEGRERYLTTMKLFAGNGELNVRPGTKNRWYADVPLKSRETTTVEASFENGGLRQTAQIDWVPLDLARTDRITIRKGDSLLMSVEGTDRGLNDLTIVNIVVAGVTNYTGYQPIQVRFDQPGVFTVTGTRLGSRKSKVYTLQVTVVEWVFGSSPAVWAGHYRDWGLTNDLRLATLESGENMSLIEKTGHHGDGRFRLRIGDATTDHMVARLGEGGPILASMPVNGFRLFTASSVGVQVLEQYEDDSQLVETGLVMSPVRPSVTVKVRLTVGGVLFENGTVEKTLTAQDFNELGEATFRFVRPKQARTSVCHRLGVYEGDVPLGETD